MLGATEQNFVTGNLAGPALDWLWSVSY